MKKEFQIEEQYKLYLQRMSLHEDRMHPAQKTQLKQTFFGAWGQILILLRDEVSVLEEVDACKVMDGMMNQIADFFLKEKGKAN